MREPLASVVYAGGGTGGHVTPMIAIHEAVLAERRGVVPVFLTSDRAIDRRVLEPTGFPMLALPAQPLRKSIGGLARFARAWTPSVRTVREVIRHARGAADGRVEFVTTGGFVAGPAARAARAEGVPITLVNLDRVPGKASRLVAGSADRVFTTGQHPGWTTLGPIVRAGVGFGEKPGRARAAFGLDRDRPTLLITGGSQGARSLNDFALALLERHPGAFERWQVVHQCGEGPIVERARSAWNSAGVRAKVDAYFDNMGRPWSAATLALARAGAGTVADARRSATPTVFLPYPHHRDRHQHENARPMVEAGGAIMLEDRVDATANAQEHAAALLPLLEPDAPLENMRHAIRGLGACDGALVVARALLET